MIIKTCAYVDDRCILTFRDCDFHISLPINDDPGLQPGDELIITNTRIWRIIRYYKPDLNINFIDDDDLPFPDVF